MFGSGLPNLCIPPCDALAQECGELWVCVSSPLPGNFECQHDASGSQGAYGSACESINGCDPGLACLDPAAVPEADCEGDAGCCSPYCDLMAANSCPGQGQICDHIWEPGDEAPGLEHVGVCRLP